MFEQRVDEPRIESHRGECQVVRALCTQFVTPVPIAHDIRSLAPSNEHSPLERVTGGRLRQRDALFEQRGESTIKIAQREQASAQLINDQRHQTRPCPCRPVLR